ncbi:unnamed protein product [Rhizoctonia solani]|uniref:Uncharacterized protein n=1 Tax=Rhizoctonia solani TaxID=456999 RepID=A0A8H3CWH2_9AGAM
MHNEMLKNAFPPRCGYPTVYSRKSNPFGSPSEPYAVRFRTHDTYDLWRVGSKLGRIKHLTRVICTQRCSVRIVQLFIIKLYTSAWPSRCHRDTLLHPCGPGTPTLEDYWENEV